MSKVVGLDQLLRRPKQTLWISLDAVSVEQSRPLSDAPLENLIPKY